MCPAIGTRGGDGPARNTESGQVLVLDLLVSCQRYNPARRTGVIDPVNGLNPAEILVKRTSQLSELDFSRRRALLPQGRDNAIDRKEARFQIAFQVLADVRASKDMMSYLLFILTRFNCELSVKRNGKNGDKCNPGDSKRRRCEARSQT
ncbi:hypothetical protein [Nisaea nitritireducens]|uniref:hypothetical protein n=1 Tax=Nisaea nitritireducens TaxID=568392 RepID=UPI001D02B45B|nr:hypothetical protein [Nisaea nitritireducens]